MNTEVLSHQRFDIYRTVTESIIAAIETGAEEFVMPWHGSGAPIAKPQNAHTHLEYHGINVLALWAHAHDRGYQSGYWGTYHQWQEVGAQVVKGEKSSTIVFFKRIEEEAPQEGEKPFNRLFARASRVFNADQVSGWVAPAERYIPGKAEVIESLANFVKFTGAAVQWGGALACYHIVGDYIEMPAKERFLDTAASSATQNLGATLLHELVHWSGAKQRLARFEASAKKQDVAMEELVAELGAAFLCADLAVTNEPGPYHAAYIASWLQLLKNDTRAIFTASRLANQAAMYLHELASAGEW